MPPTVTEIPTPEAQDTSLDLGRLFPSLIPQPERIVYQHVKDACGRRAVFPPDGQGLAFPVQFNVPPDISLFPGLDETSPPLKLADGTLREINRIPVVRGWPAFPGQVPAIGVAESVSPEDASEDIVQAGFAGDVFAYDADGNVLATCSYYAEPLRVTVVVELIHTNRDERDRLHDQLRKVIYPLRSIIPASSGQVRDVKVSGEKQDLPLDEQPLVMYVSLFTVDVTAEMLIATEIVPGGVIEAITTAIDVQPTLYPSPENVDRDLT